MTEEEIAQASIDKGKRIIQERIDARQLTPEEKSERQIRLRPQINAQHKACMKLPVNVAKLKAIRDSR